MSKIILEGAIETILLLDILDFNKPLSSSEIYKEFPIKNPAIILKRLNKLWLEGFLWKINKKEIGKKIELGGDKLEWHFEKQGKEFLTEIKKKLKSLKDF